MVQNATKIDRVFEALVNRGEQLTASQIKSRYGIANPHDAVYQLRQMGFAVYLNEHTDTSGRVTQKYRVGNPSRALVAAGYRAMAAGL